MIATAAVVAQPVAAARVLHVITRMIVGGAQWTTLLQVAGLRQRGWQVDLLSGPETGPEGSLAREVSARGVRWMVEPALMRAIHPTKDVIAVMRLVRLMRAGRYQIVHSHSSKAGILARAAARLARVPVIVHTVHGWGFHDRQLKMIRFIFQQLERGVASWTDALVAVSSHDAALGARAGIATPDRYRLVRQAIDPARFDVATAAARAARAELGLGDDALVVGTVGRLSPQKDPLTFVEAAALVAARCPQARFLMVGDGPLRPAIEARIAELGLGPRIVLTGLRTDVPVLLHTLDALVLTSLWEGMPRVLAEAMLAGVPVVATAVGGSVEALGAGARGVVVPTRQPEVVARAVLDLLSSPTAARDRTAAARRWAEEEFAPERSVGEIEAVYRELLARRRADDPRSEHGRGRRGARDG